MRRCLTGSGKTPSDCINPFVSKPTFVAAFRLRLRQASRKKAQHIAAEMPRIFSLALLVSSEKRSLLRRRKHVMRLVLLFLGLFWAQSAFCKKANALASLSQLTPEKHAAPWLEARMTPLIVHQKPFSDHKRPTEEASHRLKAMNQAYEEKLKYRIATQNDDRAYLAANHDLARWYVRALLRAELSSLFHQARGNWKDARRRSELRRAAEAEDAVRTHSMTGLSGASRAVASIQDTNVDKESEGRAEDDSGAMSFGWLLVFLSRASWFVERLTNSGIEFGHENDDLTAKVALDPQGAILKADVHVPLIDMGLRFRLRPPDKPLPFSGQERSDEERLTLHGARTIPFVRIAGAVNYEYLRKNLSCAFSREILGPLSGIVERAWNLSGSGVPMVSRASLALSINF